MTSDLNDPDANIKGIITAIRVQRLPIKHAAIIVDGQPAASARVQDAQGLVVGQPITSQALSELNHHYQRQGSYLQAIRYLGGRDRSAMEVHKHLAAKGWDAEAAQQAIERLQREGYLDDQRFADNWVAYRCRTAPRSRVTITQELRRKGIAREIIASAVETMDEKALALACVKKKSRQWQRYRDGEKYRRIVAFLQRKAFPYTTARTAAQIFMNMAPDD